MRSAPPLDEFVQSFCFAVPKGQRQLLRVLNEGLSIVMANGTFQKLHEKWFAPRVRSKSRIIVGGDKQYPPYEYLDENGQPAGFNVELTRAIAKQLNLDISIELDSWNSIRQRLLSGNIDIIQGMFYSPERDKVVDFSPPHSIVGHTIVTRKGDLPFSNLGQLHGKSILVMEGDILHDLALKMGLTKELITVPSPGGSLAPPRRRAGRLCFSRPYPGFLYGSGNTTGTICWSGRNRFFPPKKATPPCTATERYWPIFRKGCIFSKKTVNTDSFIPNGLPPMTPPRTASKRPSDTQFTVLPQSLSCC